MNSVAINLVGSSENLGENRTKQAEIRVLDRKFIQKKDGKRVA